MDRERATSATITHSKATGGKGAQQLLLDSNSCTTRLENCTDFTSPCKFFTFIYSSIIVIYSTMFSVKPLRCPWTSTANANWLKKRCCRTKWVQKIWRQDCMSVVIYFHNCHSHNAVPVWKYASWNLYRLESTALYQLRLSNCHRLQV